MNGEVIEYMKNSLSMGWKEISEELSISEKEAKFLLYDFYRNGSKNVEVAVTMEGVPTFKDQSLFRYQSIDEKREKVKNTIEEQFSGKDVKILYLSDLHVPFTDYAIVEKAINKHKDADILFINGDLLDLFSVSKFAKDKRVEVKREINEARGFLETVSKMFKAVVITEGNHERRLSSYVKDVIDPDMQFLFNTDILWLLVNGSIVDKPSIPNVHVVGSWWINLWDIVFAHPDNYSAPPLKTVIDASQHFISEGIYHRVCVIGHTHQAGEKIHNGVKVMETGYLSHPMDYHKGSKFSKTTWTKAHAVFYIDKNGVTDYNESRVIYL